MTENTGAVDQELEVLEKGLHTPGGVKLGFKTKAERDSFRMKLYRRRNTDRAETAKMLDKPMYKGLSPYDALAMNYFESKKGLPAMHVCITQAPEILEE